MITRGSRVKFRMGDPRSPSRWRGTVTSVDEHVVYVRWDNRREDRDVCAYSLDSIEAADDDTGA